MSLPRRQDFTITYSDHAFGGLDLTVRVTRMPTGSLLVHWATLEDGRDVSNEYRARLFRDPQGCKDLADAIDMERQRAKAKDLGVTVGDVILAEFALGADGKLMYERHGEILAAWTEAAPVERYQRKQPPAAEAST